MKKEIPLNKLDINLYGGHTISNILKQNLSIDISNGWIEESITALQMQNIGKANNALYFIMSSRDESEVAYRIAQDYKQIGQGPLKVIVKGDLNSLEHYMIMAIFEEKLNITQPQKKIIYEKIVNSIKSSDLNISDIKSINAFQINTVQPLDPKAKDITTNIYVEIKNKLGGID